METIRFFSGLGKNDAHIAGGKGASLGEMTQAGIPVPPGFVVLAETFEHFLEMSGLHVEIQAALDVVTHHELETVEHASQAIQGLILHAEIPEEIERAINDGFVDLNAEWVAVRSSATAEDGAEASWAGELDSYLNTSRENLVTNVRRCWASLFTPRAIFYRFEKGFDKSKVSVAVVVQKMVQSEISGIAFSVHPVTQDYNQLIIEAGLGLGEAIVSGSITPDSYVVTKDTREIVDTYVATQERALYRGQDGGVAWHDLSPEQQGVQVLTEAQILALADIVMTIEKHYGFPCDIEWAMEVGTFYIVQSRPITTLG